MRCARYCTADQDGRLVAVADQFLFVNRQSPEQSFTFRKSNIIQSSTDHDVLTIRTGTAVNGATEFTFRLDSARATDVLAWLGASGTPSFALDARAPEDTFADTTSGGNQVDANNLIGEYRVAHKHFLGKCEGTLRISDDGIEFQSVTSADHSRRWDMSDVKEIEHDNRDDLRIAPLIGNEYDFEFVSERRMSDSEFRRLSDRVAGARLDEHR